MELKKGETTAQTAITIAQSFLGQTYKSGTLEASPKEQLVCNLKEFDCWTFVETVSAMAVTRHSSKPSFTSFLNNLKKLRYRDGQIDGYASRLHYFKEWAIRAEENKIVQDMTEMIGGKLSEKQIHFMTSHRDLYPQLKNIETFSALENYENQLNKYDFYYIPKADVKKIESEIQDGDIIAITSIIEGLDFNHEGFAIRKNGRIHLLHASQELKKIVISPEPLTDYLNRFKKHSGIAVVRLLQ
ncbi:N-acetylmuramoyl-L-alanine amidase-like domain-containing protein [Emticicia sp. BO119]|uniref:N-acetylmuramoyl-L-alanine amidase-like domain-containing protein n=1 Tax=Emticicia sp. BO119 TaxID=2757768 RepID=UPI001E5699A7|nr:N-acetylmuramoyl-L-alanine amidase-like domain-containing protein [Emticicia sp. BO119]